jgi:hypothetical protein
MTPVKRMVRAARHYGPTWRYVFNFSPTLSYRWNHRRLQGEAAAVLNTLNRDGVAITSAEALLGAGSCYAELCGAVEGFQASSQAEIASAQRGVDDRNAIGKKTFTLEYLGRNPKFDPVSVYARFALERNILGVANAYLGMRSRLRYYNVWHTFPTNADARESQLWHRDREDYLIVKVFLYLSDVDEGAGPFTYARGSHPKGNLQAEAAHFLEGHVKRSTDAQMAELIPREKWFKGVGPKGTIIFADARGYHCGGLARSSARIMYTAMFTSPASQSEEFMVNGTKFSLPLDADQAFAISGRK